MRWYSAPGCDDPKLHGARAFKGLKVNSSIAHLYQRPRVWVEAFHSSGWGTTPADVVAALNEDFAYGATVVNLHGLYYSTRGGWWEWAPPDFHFRQPYWEHARKLNDYFTRVSWLLSQGIAPLRRRDRLSDRRARCGTRRSRTLRCDRPYGQRKHQQRRRAISRSPRKPPSAWANTSSIMPATSTSSTSSRSPPPSTANANCGRAQRAIACSSFPRWRAVRYSMIEKARDFVRAGGLVIAFGCLPWPATASAAMDPELDSLLEEIFGASAATR